MPGLESWTNSHEPVKGSKMEDFREFDSPFVLRVTDKLQEGLIQERWIDDLLQGSSLNTLEYLVSRRSDGVGTVHKSDLHDIIDQSHAPHGV